MTPSGGHRPKVRFAITVGTLGAGAKSLLDLEAMGYDGAWTGDHVMTGRPLGDCLTHLAAAAVLSKRLDIISCVLLLPLRHPIPTCKALTNIDHLSEGRLTVGVGVGGEYPEEWKACGMNPKERGARMDEALPLLRRLWTEEEVTSQGRFYPLHDVTLQPRPVQRPHPPLWVGGRAEASQRRAAAHAQGWVPYLVAPERFAEGKANIERMAREQGRDLAAEGFTWGTLAFVGLTDVGAYDPSKDPTRPDRKRGNKYYLIGDTASCIERLQAYRDAGVQYFTLAWVCDPVLAGEHAKRFAERVIPALR